MTDSDGNQAAETGPERSERRNFLKRSAQAGGVAFAAPAVYAVMANPAAAASCDSCPPGSYWVNLQETTNTTLEDRGAGDTTTLCYQSIVGGGVPSCDSDSIGLTWAVLNDTNQAGNTGGGGGVQNGINHSNGDRVVSSVEFLLNPPAGCNCVIGEVVGSVHNTSWSGECPDPLCQSASAGNGLVVKSGAAGGLGTGTVTVHPYRDGNYACEQNGPGNDNRWLHWGQWSADGTMGFLTNIIVRIDCV